MSIIQNTDYLDEARGRLLEQYKGLPRFDAVLQAFSQEIQLLENNLWSVFVQRELQNGTATGDLLAKLGKLVGQANQGWSDPQYLIFITARIAVNHSDGHRETLTKICNLLMPGNTFFVRDLPPASLMISPNSGPITYAYVIAVQFLAFAVAAGVWLVFVYPPATRANMLIMGWGGGSDGLGITANQSPGWSGTPGTGGQLAATFSMIGVP